MQQIKTIIHDVPEEFDRQVNQAIQSGFSLIQRGLVQVTDRASSLYAELVKFGDESPVDPHVPKRVIEDEQECTECHEGCVCIDCVLDAMRFIKFCCDEHEYCPDCPLYMYCRGNLPCEWDLSKWDIQNK